MGTSAVLSKLDLVLANPVRSLSSRHSPSTVGVEDGMGTVSTSNPGWQLTKWPLGDGGGAGRNPGLLHVCAEADCWENPMTLKPSLSLLTDENKPKSSPIRKCL